MRRKYFYFTDSCDIYQCHVLIPYFVLHVISLKYAKKMSNGINTDEDPSSWRPYHTFVDHLIEKYAKNELNQGT